MLLDGCLCPTCYDHAHLLVARGIDGRWLTQAELDSEAERERWYAAEVARMAERAPA